MLGKNKIQPTEANSGFRILARPVSRISLAQLASNYEVSRRALHALKTF